jgi:hypothetical protein
MSETTVTLGKQILHEDDLQIKVEYKGDSFSLRYPNPLQRSMIEQEIAKRLGGLSRSAYDPEHLMMITASCYVDNLYEPKGCPVWFDGAWTCYDEALIAELYAGYLRFRDSFREKLRKSEFH